MTNVVGKQFHIDEWTEMCQREKRRNRRPTTCKQTWIAWALYTMPLFEGTTQPVVHLALKKNKL